MIVFLGTQFKAEYANFPEEDKQKIAVFIAHVQKYGFDNLPGRNKKSDNVPHDDSDWLNKVRYAQEHHLWHYHIGIPDYAQDTPFGDWTSEYVLHYVRGDGYIKIVDFTPHPPLTLPTAPYLR